MVKNMSLTSILKARPEVVDFLVSRINNIPKKPSTPEKKQFFQGEDPALVGTAFDYAFRFEVLRKYPHATEKQWIAESGASMIRQKAWREIASQTIKTTKYVRDAYYETPSKENLRRLVEMCFRISHLDMVYREGKLPSGPIPKERLMPAPLDIEIEDVISMLSNSTEFINSKRFSRSSLIMLNPSFGWYSKLVGGADADIITSTSLIDLKATSSIKINKLTLAQIVGYYMLILMSNRNIPASKFQKLHSFPDVKEIGMFFPRFSTEYIIPCNDISITNEDIIKFRELANIIPFDNSHNITGKQGNKGIIVNECPVVVENMYDLLKIIDFDNNQKLLEKVMGNLNMNGNNMNYTDLSGVKWHISKIGNHYEINKIIQ